jgi:acylphosphatase
MTQKSDLVRLHARVEGHVQGVGFRYFVLNLANELGLMGWVRNTYNGDVEVTAEGSRGHLEILLEDLRQGPPSAYVIDVNYEWMESDGEKFQGFIVKS